MCLAERKQERQTVTASVHNGVLQNTFQKLEHNVRALLPKEKAPATTAVLWNPPPLPKNYAAAHVSTWM